MKIINKYKINNENEIRFLNIPIYSYGTRCQHNFEIMEYVELFPKTFKHQVYDEFLKLTEKKHDFIIIVRAGLGEAYLLNYMLDEIFQRFNTQNPCFVGHRAFYDELFSLYYPDIPYYTHNVDTSFMFKVLDKKIDKYKNHIFNVNPSPFKDWAKKLTQLKNGEIDENYSEIVKKFNNVKNFKNKEIHYKKDIEKIVATKFPEMKKKKFIFIVQGANFVQLLPNSFWEKLIFKIEDLGYKVILNTENISLQEARYIASHSKAIIAIRGGFSEILSTLNVPKHIIYTPRRADDIKNMAEIFSLKKYPFVDSQTIYEYDSQNTDLETIYESIIGGIEN